VFFEGILASLFHLTAACDVPWVYSIHPIDLLAVLNNNHIAGEGANHRRCVSDDQGCTANVCLLSVGEAPILYCANTGDSRSILIRNSHAVPLSIDHKPSLAGERRRVLHAGGKVYGKMDPRVQGDLNLSRAIGDWRHKQNDSLPLELQIISPRPDITITNLTKEDEYIVLACDGVWERFSSADMATFVAALGAQRGDASVNPCRKSFLRHSLGSDEVAGNRSAAAIASAICAATVRKPSEFPGLPIGVTIGCDNMSVIVVKLESGIREKASENAPAESIDHHKLTLPVISYGAQVPDDWKPPTPKSSPAGKRKSSGKKSASSSHHI
jgi:serine/threonine protein phosphatase PrpC